MKIVALFRQHGKDWFIRSTMLFVLLNALSLALIFAFHKIKTSDHMEEVMRVEQYALDLQAHMMEGEFDVVVGDIIAIASQREIQNYLDSRSESELRELSEEILAFVKARQVYDQVRVIAADGKEAVRVVWEKGRAKIVPSAYLQNQAHRDFFQSGMQLPRGSIYLSPLDLKLDNGEIAKPFTPVIRLTMPVFAENGERNGVVVLNFLAIRIIKNLLEISRLSSGDTMLLNAHGYWLMHPDPRMEWGFLFADRSENSMASMQPELWQAMENASKGQFMTDDGLYTFTTIQPLASTHSDSRIFRTQENTGEEVVWKLVSHVSAQQMNKQTSSLDSLLIKIALFLMLGAALISISVAYSLMQRKIYSDKLEQLAYHDTLTGLPNRKLFFDMLGKIHAMSVRYENNYAIMFIDLDGFKDVNDTHGHETGDSLLKTFAATLQKVCRDSDTIARLGGDEFAIILPSGVSREKAATVAEKILLALKQPVVCNSNLCDISASIGIALSRPEKSAEDVLSAADEAMYQAKRKGKGKYQFG